MLSPGIAVCVAAALVGGPRLGVLTVLVGTGLSEIFLRRNMWTDPKRFALVAGFNVSQLLLSVSAAGAFYQAVGGNPSFTTPLDFLRAVAAFAIYSAANLVLVTNVVALSERKPWLSRLRVTLRLHIVQLVTLGILAILLAILHNLSPWYLILGILPLFVVQISIREQVRLREQTRQAFEKLSEAISSRDPYTGKHSEEVAKYAVKLAQALKLPEEQVEQIEAAAHIHDLGKIAVPDAILLKPGPLTPEEWEVVKRHPVVGAELIAGLPIYKGVVEIIRHEHEHWDGTGYPNGLKGEEIPLGARIIAVADVWHALLSDRPYRKAYSKEEACKIMQDMAGKVLDPKLVELFLKIVE